jgi:hypothetical protein
MILSASIGGLRLFFEMAFRRYGSVFVPALRGGKLFYLLPYRFRAPLINRNS